MEVVHRSLQLINQNDQKTKTNINRIFNRIYCYANNYMDIITYSNIIRHDNTPFEDYLKLPGYSHSFCKYNKNGIRVPITVTENMRIGSIVDNILTEPDKANMADPLYPYCKKIAFSIKERFGDLITVFEKQVSFTASIQYGNFIMPTTGRLDFGLKGNAVIDLKVTKSKLSAVPTLIEFMGYKNQGYHYCKMYGVDNFYLMVHSIPDNKTEVFFYSMSDNYNTFWANAVMQFGSVIPVQA